MRPLQSYRLEQFSKTGGTVPRYALVGLRGCTTESYRFPERSFPQHAYPFKYYVARPLSTLARVRV